MTSKIHPVPGKQTKEKRKYHSPLRQQQAAETRERIIAAGSTLVHGFPSWDWKNLTARAVGERAGVSERTVQRHFASEQALRDAVLHRLVEESGVNLEELDLASFDDVIIGMFRYLSSFATATDIVQDPAQTKLDQLRKAALVEAVREVIPSWTEREQELVAAVLDTLWQPATQDRLKLAWGVDADDFPRLARWFTSLIRDALYQGNKP